MNAGRSKIILSVLFLALLWSTRVNGQTESQRYDDAFETIRKIEHTSVFFLDTVVSYQFYEPYHGHMVTRASPIRISFDSSKAIICVINLTNKGANYFVYWFSKGQFLARQMVEEIHPNDVGITIHPYDMEISFIDAVLRIAKSDDALQRLQVIK